ncbi:hypothetical protein IPM62_01880 [Candidatus Woesebacteria bacterium]|nr:MAG: hypothetical protein IPM62_01880 [Candidatus Woesebacteria bacterium]
MTPDLDLARQPLYCDKRGKNPIKRQDGGHEGSRIIPIERYKQVNHNSHPPKEEQVNPQVKRR